MPSLALQIHNFGEKYGKQHFFLDLHYFDADQDPGCNCDRIVKNLLHKNNKTLASGEGHSQWDRVVEPCIPERCK